MNLSVRWIVYSVSSWNNQTIYRYIYKKKIESEEEDGPAICELLHIIESFFVCLFVFVFFVVISSDDERQQKTFISTMSNNSMIDIFAYLNRAIFRRNQWFHAPTCRRSMEV